MRCVIESDEDDIPFTHIDFFLGCGWFCMLVYIGVLFFFAAFCSDASDASVKSSLALDPQKTFSWICNCDLFEKSFLRCHGIRHAFTLISIMNNFWPSNIAGNSPLKAIHLYKAMDFPWLSEIAGG